jgi:hypothetical protein
MIRIAANHRVIFKLTEAPGKGHVIGTADVLITQEQHAVLEQLRANFGKKTVVMYRVGKADALKLGANAARQLFDSHG